MLTETQAADQSGPCMRHDWSKLEVRELFKLPFNDLVYKAHTIHRNNFNHNEIQLSTLLNVKEGGCSEDCGYCPQSARHDTGVKAGPIMPYEEVIRAAEQAKQEGASRFCMGAAWRAPKKHELKKITEMIKGVKELRMESCVTLGMLSEEQAIELKQTGLDYYNHNLDTSEDFYGKIITTRTLDDRLNTLKHVRDANIKVCSGGIIGIGETLSDRADMLRTLSNLPKHPESIPINLLIRIEGTPLSDVGKLAPLELVKTIAVTRILMPASYVRLSAGRTELIDAVQALCFFAGANSVFYGDRLLITENPSNQKDMDLFDRLGLEPTA